MNRLMAIISIATLLLISCGEKEKLVEVPANCPPSAPRGVYSINLDGTVMICWYANPEADVKGYDVYRGASLYGDYNYLATVLANSPHSGDTYCYEDVDTQNGVQYYYAVLAYDKGELESDLSYEEVTGTPRPEGQVTLFDAAGDSLHSGYDLSSLSSASQASGLESTDFYFEKVAGISSLIVPAGKNVLIQDYGYVGNFDAINYAPDQGWSPSGSVETIVGHIYILKLLETDGYHFAKLYVTEASGNFVTFSWAYQTAKDNRDLAPPAPGRGTGNNSSAPGGGAHARAEIGRKADHTFSDPPIVERVTWTRDFEFRQQTTI